MPSVTAWLEFAKQATRRDTCCNWFRQRTQLVVPRAVKFCQHKGISVAFLPFVRCYDRRSPVVAKSSETEPRSRSQTTSRKYEYLFRLSHSSLPPLRLLFAVGTHLPGPAAEWKKKRLCSSRNRRLSFHSLVSHSSARTSFISSQSSKSVLVRQSPQSKGFTDSFASDTFRESDIRRARECSVLVKASHR